jgi:hypothetical protein
LVPGTGKKDNVGFRGHGDALGKAVEIFRLAEARPACFFIFVGGAMTCLLVGKDDNEGD